MVAASLNGTVRSWYFNSVELESFDCLANTSATKLESGVTCLSLNHTFEEGIVATCEGGLYFIDLVQKKTVIFLQGIDYHNNIIRTLNINKDMMVTIHAMGDVKVWSAQTGEILKEFKWKYPVIFLM